jgi:hypothetical protein
MGAVTRGECRPRAARRRRCVGRRPRPIIRRVGGTVTCGVCGTVNVGVFARCIACGQEIGQEAGPASDSAIEHEDTDTASRERAEVPLQQENDVTGPIVPPKPPSSVAGKQRSLHADEASQELDSASYRQTVIEIQPGAETTKIPPPTPALEKAPTPKKGHRREDPPTVEAAPPVHATRFVARLLLPEGDRRSVELSKKPLSLGSGLDELGLAGDPRVGTAEARVWVEEGRVWVEPSADARNIYRRIDREMKLVEGDVVLMGDVAATFTKVDAGPPVDGAKQVLGGSANAPCGRLVFLRRDGSPGPVHDLPAGKTVVGRTDGHLNFPNDSRLSRRHALFFASDSGVTIEDMDSRNGTYLRLRAKQQLEPEDALRGGSAGVQIRAR